MSGIAIILTSGNEVLHSPAQSPEEVMNSLRTINEYTLKLVPMLSYSDTNLGGTDVQFSSFNIWKTKTKY